MKALSSSWVAPFSLWFYFVSALLDKTTAESGRSNGSGLKHLLMGYTQQKHIASGQESIGFIEDVGSLEVSPRRQLAYGQCFGVCGTVKPTYYGAMRSPTCSFRTGIYGAYDPCNTPAVVASTYANPIYSQLLSRNPLPQTGPHFVF